LGGLDASFSSLKGSLFQGNTLAGMSHFPLDVHKGSFPLTNSYQKRRNKEDNDVDAQPLCDPVMFAEEPLYG